MTDAHAHLDGCGEEAGVLIQRAREAGVTRIVTIGTGVASSHAAIAIAERHKEVVAAVGIDPHQASSAEAARLGELEALLAHPRVVAVGETGLDGYRAHATPADQRRLFNAHLELAAAHGLPVVVHSREAERETAAALAGFPGVVVLHCFSSLGLLERALEERWFISFAGNVTFPKAAALRAAAAVVPRDRILAETDSPYLAPQPVRGRPCEPAFVRHTLEALAAARGEAIDEVEAAIDANARRAFGLG